MNEIIPNNYSDIYQNEKYHHSLKGCEVKLIKYRCKNGGIIINKHCITHNIICSKTGWELGYYNGVKSHDTSGFCIICGKDLIKSGRTIYCKECRNLSISFLSFLNWNYYKDHRPYARLKLLNVKYLEYCKLRFKKDTTRDRLITKLLDYQIEELNKKINKK